MTFSNRVMVEHSIVFGNAVENPKELAEKMIACLNSQIAFQVIGRLNHAARHMDLSSVQKEMDAWFGEGKPISEQYTNKIVDAYRGKDDTENLMLINLWTNFTLLEIILDQDVHHSTAEINFDEETSIKLLECYLLLNEHFVRKGRKIFEAIPKNIPVLQMAAFYNATAVIPYHDFTHLDEPTVLFIQFIKSAYFLMFMEQELPEALRMFLIEYGQESWQMYLRALMPISDHMLRAKGEGVGYLTIDKDGEGAGKSKAFLNRLAIGDTGTYNSGQDFISLRSRPIMKINDTKFLVIDSLLLYNKFYNSLYFEFDKIIQVNPNIFSKGNFKGWLNDNFTESFLANQVLDYIFINDQFLKWPGSKIKYVFGNKVTAEPDYYVRRNNFVLVFELKDSFIKGSVKQSFNPIELEADLKEKLWYYIEKNKDGSQKRGKDGKLKERPKAVRQIKNSIKTILKKRFVFDQNFDPDTLVIYPILLYLDQALSAPGINDILNYWFQTEISQDKELIEAKATIMPLTAIDVDLLVQYQDVFSEGHLLLEKVVYEYWIECDEFKRKGLVPPKIEILGRGMISFSAYLRSNYPLRKEPKIFTEIAKSLF